MPSAEEIRETGNDFEGERDIDSRGRETVTFPALSRALGEGEAMRRKLRLEQQEVGEIVFSSADDSDEAERREMREFERELAQEQQPEEEEFEV